MKIFSPFKKKSHVMPLLCLTAALTSSLSFAGSSDEEEDFERSTTSSSPVRPHSARYRSSATAVEIIPFKTPAEVDAFLHFCQVRIMAHHATMHEIHMDINRQIEQNLKALKRQTLFSHPSEESDPETAATQWTEEKMKWWFLWMATGEKPIEHSELLRKASTTGVWSQKGSSHSLLSDADGGGESSSPRSSRYSSAVLSPEKAHAAHAAIMEDVKGTFLALIAELPSEGSSQ